MAQIAFTSGEGGGFELLPVGSYTFRVIKNEVKPAASAEKSPSMHVKVQVVDGPQEEKTAMLFCTLKPEKGWMLKNLIEAAIPGKYEEFDSGAKDDEGKPIKEYRFDSDDLIGATFVADVEHRKDPRTNQMQHDFKKIRALEGAAVVENGNNAAADTQAAPSTPAEQPLRRRIANS